MSGVTVRIRSVWSIGRICVRSRVRRCVGDVSGPDNPGQMGEGHFFCSPVQDPLQDRHSGLLYGLDEDQFCIEPPTGLRHLVGLVVHDPRGCGTPRLGCLPDSLSYFFWVSIMRMPRRRRTLGVASREHLGGQVYHKA
jgi:hypothetical protein